MNRRRHDRVQARLPQFVDEELSGVRRRLVARHLRRCEQCRDEELRQRAVADELAALARTQVAAAEATAPPPELLDQLLAQAEEPGLRERVAVPARGAVSGARPGLSVALVATVLGLALLVGWVGWRLGRSVRGPRDAVAP